MSLAEGMAAGLGARVVTADHVLLAFLWEPNWASRLKGLGWSREDLAARLAELGVSFPQSELPALDPRRWGPRVDVSMGELPILLKDLRYVMPADAQLWFNHDHKQAWIGATEGVDLAACVPRALARHRGGDHPPATGSRP